MTYRSWTDDPPPIGSVVLKRDGWIFYKVVEYLSTYSNMVDTVTLKDESNTLQDYSFIGKEYELISSPATTSYIPTKHNIVKQTGIDMTTLYKITDEAITKELGETYCTKLAKDSSGNYVVEVKGHAGKVLSVHPDYLEEVVPYTVGVKFLTSNNHPYHYISQEGKVKNGDLVWIDSTSGLAVVTHVNTKSKQATKELTGRRILTEEL